MKTLLGLNFPLLYIESSFMREVEYRLAIALERKKLALYLIFIYNKTSSNVI